MSPFKGFQQYGLHSFKVAFPGINKTLSILMKQTYIVFRSLTGIAGFGIYFIMLYNLNTRPNGSSGRALIYF